MDTSNVTSGSEDSKIQENQAEDKGEMITSNKRRNSRSPSLIDEPVIKKTKTDCDKSETTEESNEENITQPVKSRKEAVKLPKLYRLLHEDEDETEELTAISPDATTDVATHVATGSQKGSYSRYISTCASLANAEKFRSLKLKSGRKWGMNNIAEIDVGSLPDDVEIIDLRTRMLRKNYEISDMEINEKFHKYARSHQEVLLVGTVPKECWKLLEHDGEFPSSDSDYY
ncbi:uncharacterized protein LOC127707496 [Mytilus californianus]|uniref:uncharacterized protein LOC127707496 n=1 Tax=Mytilus californianus TaxID=6549 RepID=UPI00224709D1|nr:uncharacterized protein LOC127707496 [Mytilus californianus]XP_052068032.1 uncharacterized protein LOC127707496 [Mytilus californianus]